VKIERGQSIATITGIDNREYSSEAVTANFL